MSSAPAPSLSQPTPKPRRRSTSASRLQGEPQPKRESSAHAIPMRQSATTTTSSAPAELCADTVLAQMITATNTRTDRCFALLMVMQWLGAVALAEWITPRTWIGDLSSPAPYVAIALLCGGIISLTPAFLVWLAPGERVTRHVVAIGQMLMSSMLIHLSGGRIETHFHIFGSLAFLAFYLDWTVLLTASAVVLADHTLGNFFWPHATFGVANSESWRWLEHAGWVLFCDLFLIVSCVGRLRNLRSLARQSAEQATLLRQAYTDALTGMPNRLRFHKELEAAIATSKTTGLGFELMYVDLDRFKEVNDTYGHAIGDRVLLAVAARLMDKQAAGSLFARIGGDEFVAICPCGPHWINAEARASQVLTELLMPIEIDGRLLTVGASIGVSLYPEHGADEDELLHHADKAMYSVKRKGRRGYVFYDESMDIEKTVNEREVAETALRQAIEQDQFSIHYQPLLSSQGTLNGLEALVRWVRPGELPVSPGEFIPLAEETGLIVSLGQLVLEKVCLQMAQWHAEKIEFGHVAVNLSPRQLDRDDFLSTLDRTLERFGVEPHWLAFEITESAYTADEQCLERILAELRHRGISISLDDFGTGYSCFGRLQGMSFDTLKIDRIFISQLGQSDTSYGVVAGIINIAHLMGMRVVAEGVETEKQRVILEELHCDVLQGYHLARPLVVSDANEFMRGIAEGPHVPPDPSCAPGASLPSALHTDAHRIPADARASGLQSRPELPASAGVLTLRVTPEANSGAVTLPASTAF